MRLGESPHCDCDGSECVRGVVGQSLGSPGGGELVSQKRILSKKPKSAARLPLSTRVNSMKITIASFDLFHLVNQAEQLDQMGVLHRFLATRALPERHRIDASRISNCLPLHYLLRILQAHWDRMGGQQTYARLCCAFDFWLRHSLPTDCDLLAILSGVGLQSFREARRAGIVTVVDCGSTHTDFQHEIVQEEFEQCGIEGALFPESYRARVRMEFEEADYIQIPSGFVGRTFLEHGIPESKLIYATYGVNHGKFTLRDEPDRAAPFRVICSSGVNPRKGARVLIEAWRKLGWRDAELHWIGKPPSNMKHLFRDMPETVHWQPWLSHDALSALYRSCDVFVLPSFEEGFARVMLEAAACGLALIVTPNTGIEDFFDPSEPEGWLVPAGRVDALCDALEAAREDRQHTYALGCRAARRAADFTWEAYGDRVASNYARILNKPEPVRVRSAQVLKQP
jgi:hypothetical protein